MGGSKGGHAHKEGEYDNTISMIDFEGRTFDARTVKNIEVENEKYDLLSPDGVTFALVVHFKDWSEDLVIKCTTIELREKKRRKLKSKLISCGVKVI